MFEKVLKLLKVKLNMFDDGEPTGAPSTSSESGSNPVNAPQTTTSSIQTEKPVVIYGKQADVTPSAQGEGEATPSNGSSDVTPLAEDRKTAYAKFKEEYKDFFGAEVQNIVKDRFKKYNGLEQQLGEVDPIISLLKEQYGAKDTKALYEMLQEKAFEDIADRDGMTVEQAREVARLKSENELFRTKAHSEHEESVKNQLISEWQRQSEDVKKEYPDFDMSAWTQNQTFIDLLGSGVGVKAAYEVCNLSNIKANTAKQMEKNVVANIQARGKRIPENGTNASSGVIIKASAKDLSRADRAEIAKRVSRGEKIEF